MIAEWRNLSDGFRGAGPVIVAGIVVCLFLIIWYVARKKRRMAGDIWTAIDEMEGHEFEHWCAELLRHNGFRDVEVTKGSHDQGVDILANKDDIKYAIQCKCYASKLGNTPVQEVFTGKTIYHCHVGAVMTNSYFTESARKAAEATGVLLWDRDKLERMLEE